MCFTLMAFLCASNPANALAKGWDVGPSGISAHRHKYQSIPLVRGKITKARACCSGHNFPILRPTAAGNGGIPMLKTWTKSLIQLGRDLNALRPHLRPNRWLVIGAVAA